VHQAPGPQLPADQQNQSGLSMAANGNNNATSTHRFSSLFSRRTYHIDESIPSTSKFIFDTNERIELDPTVLVQEMHYEVGSSICQEAISPCQPASHLRPSAGLRNCNQYPSKNDQRISNT